MKIIDLIAGARPNFMKIASIIDALRAAQTRGSALQYRLIHTGQHYDRNMSGSFFEQLGIPAPHVNLEVGSGTAAEQTSAIMTRYEKVLLEMRSDLCLVVGDVTSTMACAVVAQKLGVKVAHVEGGIRSGDWSMPEEINRLVTDSITNYFFTTSEMANDNLRRSGVGDDRVFFVGNTMIDTLLKHRPRFQKPEIWERIGLREKDFFVLTLHRPANVDNDDTLKMLIAEIVRGTLGRNIVFPAHPRTARTLQRIGIAAPNECLPASPSIGLASECAACSVPLTDRDTTLSSKRDFPKSGEVRSDSNSRLRSDGSPSNLYLISPLTYLEFNYLVERALAVITDSGGITEESTVLRVPCMTLRDSTERPETVTIGTNELVGTDPAKLAPYLERLFAGGWKKAAIPPLWDGSAGERIVNHLEHLLVTK